MNDTQKSAKPNKPVTAAKVRAVLRKAGHETSKSLATRIRGWRTITRGYYLHVPTGSRDMILKHLVGGYVTDMLDDENREHTQRKLAEYAEALRAAGIACDVGERWITIKANGGAP